ncbi:MAG: hypothetical protein HFE82_09965 [Erysipelotrichaceae bacterium]|nr:hypothetical protein [Erysipelotrichaceae bacterium]
MSDKKDRLLKRNQYFRKKRLERKKENRKQCRFQFRCTENEKAFLEGTSKKLGYKSVTEYILESSLFLSINHIELNYLSDFTVSINRLNNNINQIARNLNKLMNEDSVDIKILNEAKDSLAAYQIMLKDIELMNEKLQRKINSSIRIKEELAYDAGINYINTNMDNCPCLKEENKNGNN